MGADRSGHATEASDTPVAARDDAVNRDREPGWPGDVQVPAECRTPDVYGHAGEHDGDRSVADCSEPRRVRLVSRCCDERRGQGRGEGDLPVVGRSQHRRQSLQPREVVADQRSDVDPLHAGGSRLQRRRRLPSRHSWRCCRVAGAGRVFDVQPAGWLDRLVRRDGGPLRSALPEERRRRRGAWGVGRSAADVQASAERRLRGDHRGESRELQRHGTRVERSRRVGHRARASPAAELPLRAALRSRGRQAARQSGRDRW